MIMNKTILSTAIFICLACSSISTRAQDASFSAFLAQMKEVSAINVEAFGKKYYDTSLDTVRFAQFLPRQEHSHSCSNTELLWQEGGYMKMDGFIVVLLTRHCFDHHDRFEKHLVESWSEDYVVATYMPNGQMIDACCIGFRGGYYQCEMKYDNSRRMVSVEQSELIDEDQIYQCEDYEYQAKRYSYTIDKRGRIKRKNVGKPYKKIIYNQEAHYTRNTSLSLFEEYISLFPDLKSDSITTGAFMEGPYLQRDAYIPRAFATLFNEMTAEDCESCERIDYNHGYKLLKDSVYIVFLTKVCDHHVTKIGHFPYVSDAIATYTKSGKLIDCRDITKSGDLWSYKLKGGTVKDMSVTVRQGYIKKEDINRHPVPLKVIQTIYHILPDGHITSEYVDTKHITMHWDGSCYVWDE